MQSAQNLLRFEFIRNWRTNLRNQGLPQKLLRFNLQAPIYWAFLLNRYSTIYRLNDSVSDHIEFGLELL